MSKTDYILERRRRRMETKNVRFSESSASNVQHATRKKSFSLLSRFRRTTVATNLTCDYKTTIEHASTVGVPVQY